jgi:hypothetical protein
MYIQSPAPEIFIIQTTERTYIASERLSFTIFPGVNTNVVVFASLIRMMTAQNAV